MFNLLKSCLLAVLLATTAPVVLAQGGDNHAALRAENARLQQEVAQLRLLLDAPPKSGHTTQAAAKAKTPAEWHRLLVGKLDRSQVIRLIGAPSQAMSGFLYYEGLVRDADTGDRRTLQIFFANTTINSSGKVTAVSFF